MQIPWAPSPLAFPLLLIGLFRVLPSLSVGPYRLRPLAARSLGSLEQLARSRPCQARPDANPVAST